MTPEEELARVMAIGFPPAKPFSRRIVCPQCNGTGTLPTSICPGERVVCATCRGEKTVIVDAPLRPNA